MILRALKIILQGVILAVVAAWCLIGFPTLFLVAYKEEIMTAMESDGMDTSECRRRELARYEPTAGVPGCFASSYQDLDRRLREEIERTGEE